MLILAFICFASLVVGWLLAPTSEPRASAASMDAAMPEPATSSI